MRSGGMALLLAFTLGWTAGAQDKAPVKKAEPKVGIKDDRPDTSEEDRKLLREIGQAVDGPGLLDYFKKRTFVEADPKEMDNYIRDLADEDFDVREKAFRNLMNLGASALVGLKDAEKSPDTEVKKRAEELRRRIEASAQPLVQAACARLIAKVKPAGAAEVLLAYVPYAADQEVIDEIAMTLAVVSVSAGKVDKVVADALADKLPVKRGVAGEALVRAGAKEELPSVRKLLKDADPLVRLRVAMTLVRVREKDAVPVLVDLLEHLNQDQLWPVMEVLDLLAGEKAPTIGLGTTAATRKEARDRWHDWLTKNIDSIDLAKLEEENALLNYTLIVQQSFGAIVGGKRVPNQGEVIELDHAKNVRWKFVVPNYPVDAQVVGPERILIAEYHGGKISERDIKGNVVWEKAVGGNPIGVQRLRNGNIFVVMQNRLVEIERASGKELNVIDRPGDVFRAKKLRNGDVAFVTNVGTYIRMDPVSKKVIKTFAVGQIPVLFGSFDVTPIGHVIVPDFNRHRVVEFDADGKEVKAFACINFPNVVQRLPNGHTLVSSQNVRQIVEYDREGRAVWTHAITDGQPFNVRRR